MSYSDKARELKQSISKASTFLTDEQALEAPMLFPSWEAGHHYEEGDRFQYGEHLYKVIQTHTSQADWIPTKTPALYAEIGKPSQGDDPSNPIPYNNNMELFNGKYYSQNGVVYHCLRDSEIPVYNDLQYLVDIYVTVWEEDAPDE